ncbi:hypothetical protein IE53DRAFT_371394 [Violaceomyces palustris]|uniref:Uncharacterized protein n=1 Tax=Violaceomyces palustris TaxID=1673888 RepID=A0ACD0NNW6_9BASI|nr:hypothetical protein IE53DRAFT_371394 [Violaceomyces palustris]
MLLVSRSLATSSSTSLSPSPSSSATPSEFASSSSDTNPNRARGYRYPHNAKRRVLLSGLPDTALPNDVRRLAPTLVNSNAIFDVTFLRSGLLNQTGKAIVHFSTDVEASDFKHSADKRILGGKVVDATILSNPEMHETIDLHYANHMASLRVPLDIISAESGRVVILRGLPALTGEEKLRNKLEKRYDLVGSGPWRGKVLNRAGHNRHVIQEGSINNHNLILGPVLRLPNTHQDSSTSWFLVRLKSMSEAIRLARRWNNTYFTPQRFNIDATGGRYKVQASVAY